MADASEFRVELAGARRRKPPPGISVPVPTIILPGGEGDDDLVVELRLAPEDERKLGRLLAEGVNLTLRLE